MPLGFEERGRGLTIPSLVGSCDGLQLKSNCCSASSGRDMTDATEGLVCNEAVMR